MLKAFMFLVVSPVPYLFVGFFGFNMFRFEGGIVFVLGLFAVFIFSDWVGLVLCW